MKSREPAPAPGPAPASTTSAEDFKSIIATAGTIGTQQTQAGPLYNLLMENKDRVLAKAKESSKGISDLIKAARQAVKEDDLKERMKALGLPTGNSQEVRNILVENRNMVLNDLLLNYATDTPQAEKHAKAVDDILYKKTLFGNDKNNNKRDKYDRYLEMALEKIEEGEKSLHRDLENLRKIDEGIATIRADLRKYRKYLQDSPHPTEKEKIDEKIKKIDQYLTRIIDPETRIGNILKGTNPANRGYSAYGYSAHNYEGDEGKAEVFGDYEAAVTAASARLGTSPRDPIVQAGKLGQEIRSIPANQITGFLMIPVDVKSGVDSTGKSVYLSTSTIRVEGVSPRSEFFCNAETLKAFEEEKPIRGNFPYLHVTIPGKGTMEWARENVDAFLQVALPNEPIRMLQGSMPDECMVALILCCKFREVEYKAPYKFGKLVSDSQLAVYTDYCKQNDLSVGKKEEGKLEEHIHRPSRR